MATRKDPTPAIANPFLALFGAMPDGCSLYSLRADESDGRTTIDVLIRVNDIDACPLPIKTALAGQAQRTGALESTARVEVRQGSLLGDVLVTYEHTATYEGTLYPIEVGTCRLAYADKDRLKTKISERHCALYCSLSAGEVYYAYTEADAQEFVAAVIAADGEASILPTVESCDL
jgi:hypothetical protein